jgi:hypothetical protein
LSSRVLGAERRWWHHRGPSLHRWQMLFARAALLKGEHKQKLEFAGSARAVPALINRAAALHSPPPILPRCRKRPSAILVRVIVGGKGTGGWHWLPWWRTHMALMMKLVGSPTFHPPTPCISSGGTLDNMSKSYKGCSTPYACRSASYICWGCHRPWCSMRGAWAGGEGRLDVTPNPHLPGSSFYCIPYSLLYYPHFSPQYKMSYK